MHYPRESGSALETLDVVLKMSPIPDQKNCRDPLQRSVTATSVGGQSLQDKLSDVARGSGYLCVGGLGHAYLFPKLSEMYLLLFAEIIWRSQRSSTHTV